jgi:hypothetical protein
MGIYMARKGGNTTDDQISPVGAPSSVAEEGLTVQGKPEYERRDSRDRRKIQRRDNEHNHLLDTRSKRDRRTSERRLDDQERLQNGESVPIRKGIDVRA